MPADDPLLADAGPDVEVIETLRAGAGGAVRLDRHLARMADTAVRLGYGFDPVQARAMLAKLPEGWWRVRLALSPRGLRMTQAPLPAGPPIVRLAMAPDRLRADDPWLRVKTTRRTLYDRARAALPAGIDEMLFANRRGEVCEGTITNVFVRIGGRLLTPPVACGLLPGVLRAELLDDGEATEEVLFPGDLARAEALFVGNSLRGLIPARIA